MHCSQEERIVIVTFCPLHYCPAMTAFATTIGTSHCRRYIILNSATSSPTASTARDKSDPKVRGGGGLTLLFPSRTTPSHRPTPAVARRTKAHAHLGWE